MSYESNLPPEMTIERKIAGFEVLGQYITKRHQLITEIQDVREDYRCVAYAANICEKYPEIAEHTKQIWLTQLQNELDIVETMIMGASFQSLMEEADRRKEGAE
jgi:alkyl hydroperoxide reductase subunit AhpF